MRDEELKRFLRRGMGAQHAVNGAIAEAVTPQADNTPTPAMIATWMNRASLMDSSARTLRVSIVNLYPGSTAAALALEAMAANAALLAELRSLQGATERSAVR